MPYLCFDVFFDLIWEAWLICIYFLQTNSLICQHIWVVLMALLAKQRHYLDSTSFYLAIKRLLIKNYRGGEFTGIIDCWRSTVRNHGFLALYAGMVPNLVGEVVYRGLKYCLYDFIQVMICFHNLGICINSGWYP